MNHIKNTHLPSYRNGATTASSLVKRHGPLLLATGAAFAAMAAFDHYRTKKFERKNPLAGKFVEVDGVPLHYLERGQRQPAVLLHGNGTIAQDFDISGVLDLAADKDRVIAFDRPGYGYSERPRSTVWGPVAQAELLHRALVRNWVSSARLLLAIHGARWLPLHSA